MGYSEEMKKQVLIEVEQGKKVAEVGKEYGISVSTVYNWKKSIKETRNSNVNNVTQEAEQIKVFNEIKRLIKQMKFEPARKIGENFTANTKIQSQMITIYINEGKIEEAKKIAQRFPNDPILQSQMITIYIKEGKMESAKKIVERFPNDPIIQSQMIRIHMQEEKMNAAKEIAKRFPDNEIIQFQRIIIYRIQGNMEAAKEIAEKFPENPEIQFQMMEIYIKKGKIKEAEEIAERFPESPEIQSQMTKIQKIKGKKEDKKEERPRVEAIQQKKVIEILDAILNKPNDPTIKNEIEQLNNKWIRTILNSALADRVNLKEPAQQFIKKLKKQGYVDDIHKPIVQALEQRLQQKAKIFDIEFYKRLISKAIQQKNNSNKLHTTPYDDGR